MGFRAQPDRPLPPVPDAEGPQGDVGLSARPLFYTQMPIPRSLHDGDRDSDIMQAMQGENMF